MSKSDPTIIAEYRLCNAVYLNPDILDDPQFNYDLFTHEMAKDFCQSIDEMTKDGTPLNELSIFNKLATLNINASIDEVKTIIEINDQPVSDIKDIIGYLKDGKKKFGALQSIKEIENLLTQDGQLDEKARDKLKKAFDAADTKIFTLDDGSIKHILSMKEWGDIWHEEFLKRKTGKRYFFNDPILDEIVMDGPLPGTIGVFAAQSGMGKTTMVTHIANNFINANIPCMFFSLEMGAISTYDRLIANRLQIPYSEIVRPADQDTWASLEQLINTERQFLDENNYFKFCQDASLSLVDIKKAIEKFQEQIGQRYCVVIIDLITMVKEFCKSSQNMAQAIEIAVNELSALAKALDVHFICTAQMNRAGEAEKVVDPEDVYRFRPTRNGIKNSGALLERARYSISLFRKKFYLKQFFGDDEEIMSEPDTMEVQLLKQNNGECPRKYYLFNGECFTISPMLNTSTDLSEEE